MYHYNAFALYLLAQSLVAIPYFLLYFSVIGFKSKHHATAHVALGWFALWYLLVWVKPGFSDLALHLDIFLQAPTQYRLFCSHQAPADWFYGLSIWCLFWGAIWLQGKLWRYEMMARVIFSGILTLTWVTYLEKLTYWACRHFFY